MSSSSSSSPSRAIPSGFPAPSVEHLTAHFDSISLGSPSHPDFVGGFKGFAERRNARGKAAGESEKPLPAPPPKPRTTSDSAVPTSLQPGYGRRVRCYEPASPRDSPVMSPLPRPPDMHIVTPAMPMPMPSVPSPSNDQSLTMAYARSAPPVTNSFITVPEMPQPDNGQPHSYFQPYPYSTESTPATTPSRIVTRTRASSTPPSPVSATGSASSGSTVQCSGTTKAGKRCTRVVKGPPPLSFFAPVSGEPVERFCFQHIKEILAQSGFYSHKEGAGWVEFADWIPDYLDSDTQAALRAEMEKPASKADESGYIYAYEIRDDRAPNELRIKVGRAVKLAKRLDQWSKQCGSKEVILRGWWPGSVVDDNGTNGTSLLRGKVMAGEKGPFCHRLERLVHLELADLAVHSPYLNAGFPKTVTKSKDTKANGVVSASSAPGRSPKASRVRMPGGQPCIDCGAIHKEIFTFPRASKGAYKDKEWEKLVQPVIARWGDFVGQYI